MYQSVGGCGTPGCPATGLNFFKVVANGALGTGPNFVDPATLGVPGFNEFYYLRQYPDAAAAVQAGQYRERSCALSRHGKGQRVPGVGRGGLTDQPDRDRCRFYGDAVVDRAAERGRHLLLARSGIRSGTEQPGAVADRQCRHLVFDQRRAVRHVLCARQDDQRDRDDRAVERSRGHRGTGAVHGRARGADVALAHRSPDRPSCCTGARAAGRRSRTCWRPDLSPGLANLARLDLGQPATTFTAANVPSGTYYLRVRATNACGASSPSNEILAVVPSALPAPANLTAAVVGSSVTLLWIAPENTPVTSYLLEAGSASGLSDLARFQTGSAATSFATSGVSPGTYYVRVKTISGTATSGPSNEVVVRVLSASP